MEKTFVGCTYQVSLSSMFTKEVMECKQELFICEMHYAEDDIEYTKTGIKTPRLQALPTMNLPLKSHEDTQVERITCFSNCYNRDR